MVLFETLGKLYASHGPSGDEEGVRAAIEALAQPYADEIKTDTLGNLIIRKKGTGPKVMFAAHMDSIGFIVTHIEKEGFLRVSRLGGVSPKDAAYTPVRFKNGVRGIFAKEEKAEFGKLKPDDCFIDIGAKDEQEARKMVQVGDAAVYDTSAFCSGDKVISPYLDNRVSCAVLLKALEKTTRTENDLYFVFTVQEEVGLRGARTAAYAIDPDYAVVVDVTGVDDIPGSEKSGTVKLGKGAAIKVMDSSVICHPEIVARLEQAANEHNIPAQRDITKDGGTDGGAIHVSHMGVLSGGVSVPCRYIHTPQEMASLTDAESCVDLIAAFAQSRLKR